MTIATQATLAALLAKTLTAPATEAKQDTGNTSLATLVTNTAGLATATGQASQGTKLDTLHTDLAGPLTTQSRSTVVTASGSALNATLDGTTDTSGYSAVRVQMSGTYNATTSFEVSNDGTTWTGTYLYNPSNNGPTNQGGTSGTYAGPLTGRYFRVRLTAYTSGTATATIVYTAAATAPPPATAVALNGGSSVIGAVAIGSTTPSKITAVSAATTNATSAKTSAGTLYEITVSNPSAATVYLKLYNKASAPTVGTDVPVVTIPVAATAYICPNLGGTGKRFTTGIAWALTGAFAATDTTAVAAGVQIDGTYV